MTKMMVDLLKGRRRRREKNEMKRPKFVRRKVDTFRACHQTFRGTGFFVQIFFTVRN
jgi:hypothetical protein